MTARLAIVQPERATPDASAKQLKVVEPMAPATASELAGLPGLPATGKGVRQWLRRHNVASIPRLTGRGGGEAFPLDALPDGARRALVERREAKRAATAARGEEHRAVETAAAASPLRALKGWQRDVLDARLAVLAEIDRRAATLGAERARETLTADAAAGLLDDALAATVKRAAHGGEISVRTLRRWHAAKRQGIAALAPAARERDYLPAWAEALLALYRRPTKPSLAQCLEALPARLPEGVAMPSYDQAKRFVRALPKVDAMRGRMGSRELKTIRPYVRRDFSQLLPNDVWCADGHTADFDVAHPVHARPFRPEITTIVDIATRRVVGWSAALKENTWSVADALRNAVEAEGIPAVFYTDRGPGYVNAVVDAHALGILARLGITAEKSLPYNSQARGAIERLHQSLWVRAGRDLATYRGRDMDKQARMAVEKSIRADIAENGASPKLMRWSDFVAWGTAHIAAYNSRPHSSLGEIVDPATGAKRDRSPDEAWAAAARGGWEPVRVPPEILVDLFRPMQEAKCRRGEVRLFGNRYAHPALEAYHDRTVSVGYDIHDPTKVWVRDADERLICVAALDGNLRGYFPESVMERARVKRAARRLTTLDARIAEVRAELGGPEIEGLAAPAAIVGSEPAAEIEARAVEMLARLGETERATPAAPPSDATESAGARPVFADEFEHAEWIVTHREAANSGELAWLAGRLASPAFQISLGLSADDAGALAADLRRQLKRSA